ncbi:hypothetical protein GCM10028784_33910 [Myceligenerans cantabricum]
MARGTVLAPSAAPSPGAAGFFTSSATCSAGSPAAACAPPAPGAASAAATADLFSLTLPKVSDPQAGTTRNHAQVTGTRQFLHRNAVYHSRSTVPGDFGQG